MIKLTLCSTQELVLSGLYIYETIRILRTSLQANARKFMYQLFVINIIIMMMDIALLGVEFANLSIIETILKGLIYSIKFKLEFCFGQIGPFRHCKPKQHRWRQTTTTTKRCTAEDQLCSSQRIFQR